MFHFKKRTSPEEQIEQITPEQRIAEDELEMSNLAAEQNITATEAEKLFEADRRFLEADGKARKEAGLENKAGSYTFVCPNCQSLCKGEWVWSEGKLHGGTSCDTCGIRLIV